MQGFGDGVIDARGGAVRRRWVGEVGREVVGEEADRMGDERERRGGHVGIGFVGNFWGSGVWEREVADGKGEGFARDGFNWVDVCEVFADAANLTLDGGGCSTDEGSAGGKAGFCGFEVGSGFLLAECAGCNCCATSLETCEEFGATSLGGFELFAAGVKGAVGCCEGFLGL